VFAADSPDFKEMHVSRGLTPYGPSAWTDEIRSAPLITPSAPGSGI